MTPISNLPDHTSFLLRLVSNAVSNDFARKLASEQVTVAEWAMLRLLYDAGYLSPSAIARALGMTRGTISKLAERLLGKGLVEMTAVAGDKRTYSLSLTSKGMAKIPKLASCADDQDREFFGEIDARDEQLLRDILQVLIQKKRLLSLPMDVTP